MITKRCAARDNDKPIADYYGQPTSRDGRMAKCKECHKAHVRAWYAEARPARAEYERKRQRVRRAKYPEKNAARAAAQLSIDLSCLSAPVTKVAA